MNAIDQQSEMARANPESGAPDAIPNAAAAGPPLHAAQPTTHVRFVGGEVGELMNQVDWSATPLGPVESWPQSLRTVVGILLTSRFAMWMGWGPGLTFLYNDAYARMTLGRKHPWALGRKSADVWSEIWADIEPRVAQVLETGTATWDEELLLFLERSGYSEETYHTFSYSPLANDSDAISGLLCVVTEATERVIGERRLDTVRDLAASLNKTIAEQDVLAAAAQVLGANGKDLPFTLIYLLDPNGTTASLAGSTGLAMGHPAAPQRIALGDPNAAWPLDDMISSRDPRRIVSQLHERFVDLPLGIWDRSTDEALVVPIAQAGQDRPVGFFVVGINPHRLLDESYADFVGLISGQIAASLANARAYEEERKRAEALAELDRAKTLFFSNVSHEFRTPLTLMLGPSSDLLTGEALSPDVQNRVQVIHRNALRLQKLVNSLLDFSRIEAGRVNALYEPTDLGRFTTELASAFESATERAHLKLVMDASPLPQAVYIDRDMWEKIVLNLLSNAFKHTFEGSIAVRVRDVDGAARLEVRDTGVGIPDAEQSRVFDRFHRVPNARSRTYEGTGIGLALVQELVHRHGGTIAMESREGVGTTFSVTVPYGTSHLPRDHVATAGENAARRREPSLGALPYVEEALRWVSPRTAEMPVPAAKRTGDRSGAAIDERMDDASSDVPRILLADDNSDMREYVTRLLETRGWLVQAVSTGTDALAVARTRRPDLVLSDVMMPGLDGFGLLRALRDDPLTRAIPVVLLSARAGEEARVEGADAAADDYVVKPFAAQELLARVGAQLSLAKERAQAIEAVARAEERLRTLVAEAPVAIATTRGPDHVFETANTTYARMVGRSADLLIGRRIGDAFPELDLSDSIEKLDLAYARGESFTGTAMSAPVLRDDGRVDSGFFDFVYQPLHSPDGSISGLAIVAIEVTTQVKAREEVERALSTAEAASRAKSEFLAVMSHELRTPLNAIAGHAQLMALGIYGPVSEQQREALDRIDRSQRHLLRLVNDVLNLARIEAGHVEYAMGPVDLGNLVSEIGPMIEPQLAAKGLAYETRLPSPSPIVHADREKLTQVLLNLLSNAVKFTPAGGLVTLDAVTRDGAADDVFVRVSDTGIGVPREKEDAIFEPFVQVHVGTTRTAEGAGLGLAISRDLARGMGGDVRARSRAGKGSTFTVQLREWRNS